MIKGSQSKSYLNLFQLLLTSHSIQFFEIFEAIVENVKVFFIIFDFTCLKYQK